MLVEKKVRCTRKKSSFVIIFFRVGGCSNQVKKCVCKVRNRLLFQAVSDTIFLCVCIRCYREKKSLVFRAANLSFYL